jgi:hypothetical protein
MWSFADMSLQCDQRGNVLGDIDWDEGKFNPEYRVNVGHCGPLSKGETSHWIAAHWRSGGL